ncbi:MAG: MFS transporter [Rubrivivax sp.]|jgi:Na+/melibiose symporter-like transporter|nr:MFS transporter [Rubrivivax sp.]
MNPAPSASFRRVIAAEVVSNFGSMMSRLAIPWLAVLALGATPWQMGLLAVADVLAGATAAIGIGVLVDRWPKRAAMVAADVARAALLVGLALAAAGQQLSFGLLWAAAAAGGVLTMAFELARSAWMACAAERQDLSARNAQLAAGTAISEAVAFGITGALFQWAGGVMALLLDAASYLASALLLRRVDEVRNPAATSASSPSAPPDAGISLREALAFVAGDAQLRTLALLEGLVAAGMGIAGTSYMIYVTRDLGLPTAILGLVFAVGGIGSALGAALAPRLGRRIGGGRALAWGLALATLGNLFAPLAAGAGLIAIALLVAQQLVGDAGQVAYAVHDRTLRQTLAPPAALARVDAVLRGLGQAAGVAAALAGGWFATAHGARNGLWLAAGFFGIATGVAWLAWRGDDQSSSRAIV